MRVSTRWLFGVVLALFLAACTPADTTVPEVTIASPADNTVVTNAAITIEGTAGDDTAVTRVSYRLGDGAEQEVTVASGASVTFSFPVTLQEGANTVTVNAYDAAGNRGQDSVTVTVDTAAPTVTITSPEDGTLVTTPAVTVTGTAGNGSTVTRISYSLGDGAEQEVAITPAETVEFSFEATLQEGANTITVNAYDATGNRGQGSVTVTFSAEIGTVSGYVVNRKAGTEVAGTTVSLEGAGLSTTTDASGFYSLQVPAGLSNLTFSQEGYAASRVEGLMVEADGETRYDTIQPEIFDPFLPTVAPTLDVNVSNGDSFSGSSENDSFSVVISGSTEEPDVNGFSFADVALSRVGGNSGYLNAFVPHTPVFGFDGGETTVPLSATGFEGDTTLHVVAYDQNQNRTELIRYVTVTSSSPGGPDLAPVTDVLAIAVTFGDTSTFGTLSTDLSFSASELLEAFQSSDIEALRQQAQKVNEAGGEVAAQSFLDEVLTWVDLIFFYDFTSADLPTAFEVYRQLEGEADFQLLGQVSPQGSVVLDDEGNFLYFGYRDSTPSLQAGVEATYRVVAVSGDTSSPTPEDGADTASVTPLPAFYVEAVSPEDGATGVSVMPTYEMSFTNRNSLLFFGVIVLDRVQSEGNFGEWVGFGFDSSGITSVGVPHNFDGTASTPTLQPYHAYDWQPITITTNGTVDLEGNPVGINAISIAADFFDFFGVGFGVQDGPVNTFLTGDGNSEEE